MDGKNCGNRQKKLWKQAEKMRNRTLKKCVNRPKINENRQKNRENIPK